MYKRLSYILSIILHLAILAGAVIIPYRHIVIAEKYVPVQLAPMEEVQEQPQPPEPEPEPEPKPEPEKKISEETKKKIQDLLRTPKPTLRPTNTPKPTAKPSPTPKPTKKPTQKPKPTFTPTQAPKPLPSPTPIENKIPLSELTNPSVSKTIENATSETISVQGIEGRNYAEYAGILNAVLSNNWRTPSVRPPEIKKYTTIVSFTIQQDGRITNFKMNSSSGWSIMDRTVKEAVERSSPLRKLPPNFNTGTLQVTVPFIFNPR